MKKLILLALANYLILNAQTTWNINGNGITAGQWFGTTNATDINIKRNGVTAGFIGTSNTVFGLVTDNTLSTGTNNSSFGVDALKNTSTGSSNTAIGAFAIAFNQSGTNNTAVGHTALMFSPVPPLTNNTGSGNTGVGYGAGATLTSGSFNTLLGLGAGNLLSTGSNNTIIGANVNGYLGNTSNNIILADGAGNKGFWYSSTGIDLITTGSTTPRIRIKSDGKVLIGDPSIINTTPGTYKLYVEQGILTEKVKVALETTADWSDFVFASDYKLLSLDSVKTFINENCHLPGVPSADDVVKEGIDVAKMDALLLQKIEELTLYMIELKKEIDVLKAKQ